MAAGFGIDEFGKILIEADKNQMVDDEWTQNTTHTDDSNSIHKVDVHTKQPSAKAALKR